MKIPELRIKPRLSVPTIRHGPYFGTLVVFVLLVPGCGSTTPVSETRGDIATVPLAATHAEDTVAKQENEPPPEKPNQVVIDNFRFGPRTLTVTAGTKVMWVNRDDVPHTATSTATPRVFDSKTLDTDQQFSHVFATRGTFEYFCAVHPHMTGKVIVK
jgi:plastocyanin